MLFSESWPIIGQFFWVFGGNLSFQIYPQKSFVASLETTDVRWFFNHLPKTIWQKHSWHFFPQSFKFQFDANSANFFLHFPGSARNSFQKKIVSYFQKIYLWFLFFLRPTNCPIVFSPSILYSHTSHVVLIYS